MDRRDFVLTCSAACLPMLGACAHLNYVNATSIGGRLAIAKTELSTAPFALVTTETLDFPIYVHRDPDGSYTAVLTRCMHRGCQVEPTDGHLVCPCHGSEYTNAGAVLKGPTRLPLVPFRVETDAEHIYILTAGVTIP